ncbi:unnamed protein product [Notodromas monacha]|uniref:Protein Wnt n=1 Tax=Notodromas monacha TaxID=399045 RepID=A0A7R9BKW1_9CRUS|nr:unnamed protein product [Notodromas monacha]CAG0917098.1 unnamed protein product [Notodromas monacha]
MIGAIYNRAAFTTDTMSLNWITQGRRYLGILEEQQQQQQQVGFPAAASIAATTMMMASDAPAGGTAVYRAFCGVPSDPGNAVSGKNGSGKDADGDDDVVDWETAICRQHPLLADLDANSIRSVSQGALRGIRECQSQFAAERWNCPTFRNSTSVFGEHTMKRGSEKDDEFSCSVIDHFGRMSINIF